MIRIFIADDHQIFRKGLRQAIEDHPDLVVTGEATDGFEALEFLRTNEYDLAILDVSMPGPCGLDILKQLKAEHREIPVLILSVSPEEHYALRALRAGAAGYLTKETDEEDLIAAIRKASQGGKYITPSLAEKLAFALDTDLEKFPHENLSDREFQVMHLIARGLGIKDIASKLNLGISTISTYRARILEKTGFKSNAELINYAVKNRLVD